jgi:hypothetical protein
MRQLVARHRAEIRADTDKIGWSFAIHRTDRAATELLLALHARMSAPPPGAIVGGRVATGGTAEASMMGLPLGFAQPLVLLGLLSIPVLWWLLRLIPPQPRRIDFPPTRLCSRSSRRKKRQQKTPWWLTLLRLTLATLVIPGGGWSALEPAG